VEEKFIVVNLGKTLAMMPKAAQMPNERYVEGQKMRVVITEVNRETKGAQVLVSRADAKLVKRLFEREVPEIYQGIVEIKAIAREPGERTKIAVSSKRSDVDPIGACIGPRGQRVQVVIEELKGEKIDIFEWSENIPELIKNALSPAQILAVFPTEEKRGLMVVVEDNQLSLAIGKKGKNARLAVRLTGLKIDIKSRTDVEEKSIDWQGRFNDYLEELKVKEAEKRQKALDEVSAAESARLADIAQKQAEQEAIRFAQNEAARFAREAQEYAEKEAAAKIVEIVEVEPQVVEPVEQDEKPVEAVVVPTPVDTPIEKKESEKRIKREIKERKDYVSRFEKLASAPKPVEKKKEDYRKKKKEETEARINVAELLKTKDYDIKPTYSDEELDEIRRLEEEEAKKTWIEDEIDFDEFDDYYDTE
jgi:N utilization substance protein A